MVSKLATSLGLEGLSMVASNWEKTNTIRNMLDGGMHVRKLSKKALIISTDSNHLVFYIYIYIHILGGGFKYFLYSPLFGEDEPNLTSIFFRWVGSTTN